MAYDPYSAVNAIYKLKGEWDTANKSGNDSQKNLAAQKAQTYYNDLRRNGYGYVADELSAADYTVAKTINDKWAKNSSSTGSATFDTGVNNQAYNQAVNSALNKNNTYFDAITSDRAEVNRKYDNIYDYANQDITQTDEYQSAYKNIMPSYTLKAMQGRDNEVASGGASNGGNIDSFAAANAMRQQAAITAKGQQIAHQAGVDAYNNRVNNVRGILSDLGVYNQNVYSAMDNSISHDRGIANDVFNNDQTAINNAVDNNVKKASVTGYVPNEWAVQNDAFLKNFVDENGKLKSEFNNTDFQALINAAKANGNTELANKYAILRGLKIFGDFANYGKYLTEGDVAYYDSPRTAEYDLTSKQIDSAEKIAKGESDTTLALADKEASSALNQINAQTQGSIQQINAQTNAQKEIASATAENDGYKSLNMLYNAVGGQANVSASNFITDIIVPMMEKGEITEYELLAKATDSKNIEKYGYSAEDVKNIFKILGFDTDGLDKAFGKVSAGGGTSDNPFSIGMWGKYGNS